MPSPDSAEARLHAVERELSEFIYIVSHDLAAPFRHVRGFSELLKQDAAGFTAEQNSYCSQIQGAAEKGAAMLEQLLAYSRIIRKPLDLRECDFAALLDSVRLQLSGEIRLSGAQILAGVVGPVRVDRESFVQALRHILDNAIKFRRDGAAPRISIEAIEDGDAKRIAIADNGIGLPAVDPERLFWMFYRGDPETYPGAGAGLTIARRILRRHAGDLRFVGRPEGACVEISLPREAS